LALRLEWIGAGEQPAEPMLVQPADLGFVPSCGFTACAIEA